MDAQTQEIKDRINIADVIGQYVKLERAGKNLRARCPFHKEKTPSFFVSPERGTYICFGCGEKGDVFSFVQKMEGAAFPEVLQELAQRAGVVLKHVPVSQEKQNYTRLYAVCASAASYFASVLQGRTDVQAYLTKRGLQQDTIAQWQLGYAPASWRALVEHLRTQGFSDQEMIQAGLAIAPEKKSGDLYDRFRGRIMFPISNNNGEIIAFSGRFFEKIEGTEEGEPAKYVNSPETPIFKKSYVLYGLHRAKQAIRKLDCILLVEGQFDLLLCQQSGLPFTVALSGTALTTEHLTLLSRFSKRLVLALDGDAAGLRAGLRSTQMALAAGFDVKIPLFPEGKDPADIVCEDPAHLKSAIRESKTAIEFFLDVFQGEAGDIRAYKKRVESQLLPLVAAIGSSIDQEHFISLIAHRLEVPESAVRTEVTKASSPISHSSKGISKEIAEVPTEIPAVERAMAMVLFSYPEQAARVQELARLIGEERLAKVRAQYSAEAEYFRFSFDVLGEDKEHTSDALLQSIERGIIEEELYHLQQQLHRGEPNTQSGDILKQITALKHRQEELRK